MSHLDWREGTRADKSVLPRFHCTEPGEKMKRAPWHVIHPRPWELALEREIHTLKPVSGPRRAVLLGRDDNGLAAVTVAEMVDGASAAVIECVAVALRRRKHGGSGLADEAMDQAIEWAIGRADAAGYERLLLTAKTDPRNEHGRKLVQRAGFGPAAKHVRFDGWQMQIAL